MNNNDQFFYEADDKVFFWDYKTAAAYQLEVDLLKWCSNKFIPGMAHSPFSAIKEFLFDRSSPCNDDAEMKIKSHQYDPTKHRRLNILYRGRPNVR